MSKSSDKLLKEFDRELVTIVGNSAQALVKLLERDRADLADEQAAAEIRRTAEQQIKLYFEAMYQAFEMLLASEGHSRENIITREAIQHAVANKLTYLYAFDEIYLVKDPKFSEQYLSVVEEGAFSGGFARQTRQRQLELHRWMSKVMET